MKIKQITWTGGSWNEPIKIDGMQSAQLILIFGSTELLKKGFYLGELKEKFPDSNILGCSTAGEIVGTEVREDSLVVNILKFEKTRLSFVKVNQKEFSDSYAAGKALYGSLNKEDLKHVFVLSSGMNVNGSELVRGINEFAETGIMVTGGLAGDGERFRESYVVFNDQIEEGALVAIGFHGSDILIGCGSLGGWDPFGPERLVTRSTGNRLFEVDDVPSLELYKKYLGDYAKKLPASGLLFPLSIRIPGQPRGLVRTILSVDEETNSIIFAGDIPEGSFVRFMKANINRLLDGSYDAAKVSMSVFKDKMPELAILISCVGRKLVFKQRVEEEVEAVTEVLGQSAYLTGFYSYGEIAPFQQNEKCELHNQTMTITAFAEI